MEILQKVSATLRFPEYGEDQVALTAPKVTVTRDSDGTEIVEEATATKVAATGGEIEYWKVTVAGSSLPTPDLLTAVWSDASSTYEQSVSVVGGFVASVSAIRDRLDEEPAVAKVEASREVALGQIEDACGVAFRPSYRRESLNGDGSYRLRLSKRRLLSVLSVTVDGTALSEGELNALTLDPMGTLISDSAWAAGTRNIEVAYTHGFSNFPPAIHPVRDYAAYLLTDSPTDWDQRATSVSTDLATYSLVTPGVRGARFPLPSVNAFVAEYGAPLVA